MVRMKPERPVCGRKGRKTMRTYEEIYEMLSNLPENRLPSALDVSLEEKRQQILTKEVYQNYLGIVRAEAEKYRALPAVTLPYHNFQQFDTIGDRNSYETPYYYNRGSLATLALVSWLDGGDANIHALEDAIWGICDEYTWCITAHLRGSALTRVQDEGHIIDLFAAETACALSEIIALLGDKLAPIVVKRARHLIKERVLDRFLAENFNWEHAKHNWAAVCGGSVGIAALYEAKDTETMAKIVCKVQGVLESYLSGFPEDGTSLEGISYWAYGFWFFTSYAEMLFRMTGGKLDLFDDEHVHQIALFQQKAYFSGYNFIKFADCTKGDTTRWWGLTSYLKSRYSEVQFLPRDYFTIYEGDSCYRWVSVLRDLVWSDDRYPANRTPGECYLLTGAQWLICNSANGMGMAAKAGNNADSHNHNDVGTVQLFKNGDEVLQDCGKGIYDGSYFGPRRYEYFVASSRSHNVPVIDGNHQQPGAERCAKNVEMGEWFIDMDMAAAYDLPQLTSLHRRVEFDPVGRVQLADEFVFDAPGHTVAERFTSRCVPTAEEGRIVFTGEHSQTVLTFDPAVLTAKISTEDVELAKNNNFLETVTIHVVDLVAENAPAKCRFAFTVE